MRIKNLLPLGLAFAAVTGVYAQSTETSVLIDHNTQRYLGSVSSLDRDKYLCIHSSSDSDSDISAFLTEYGVTVGRRFWGPHNYSANQGYEVGTYPESVADELQETAVLSTHKMLVATQNPTAYVKYPMTDAEIEAAGVWAAEWYANPIRYGSTTPKFFEPINEPFVHAYLFTPNGYTDADLMKEVYADFYVACAKYIHADPRLVNMSVVGYSSAYPQWEGGDFEYWEENAYMFYNKFKDAGVTLDGSSIHLYDGINVTGATSRRSGSNGEAILDLCENGTYNLFGNVVPHSITEYGGIDAGDGSSYKCLVSMNHIMIGLMERQEALANSVPFICDKSTWNYSETNYEPYGAALFWPTSAEDYVAGNGTTWYLNDKKWFFEFWKGLKGDRVDITSSNPDVQVLAFKDGATLYVVLDNLDDATQTVTLSNRSGWSGVNSVVERSFRVDTTSDGLTVEYEPTDMAEIPSYIELLQDETKMYVISLAESGSYKNTIRRTKYYGDNIVNRVNNGGNSSSGTASFTFNGVDKGSGFGYVTARMSIGYDFASQAENMEFYIEDYNPVFKINGIEVEVPTNWKGYRQMLRDDFFGMIEVPLDMTYINSGTNTIEVSFSNVSNAMTVASMILSVEAFDSEPDYSSSEIMNGSFEFSSCSDWRPWSSWGSLTVVSDKASVGSKSLQIDGKAGVYQVLSIDPEEDYNITVDYYTENGSEVTLLIMAGDTPVSKQLLSSDGGWSRKVLSFDHNDESSIRVSVGVEELGQRAWIDNISINKR